MGKLITFDDGKRACMAMGCIGHKNKCVVGGGSTHWIGVCIGQGGVSSPFPA